MTRKTENDNKQVKSPNSQNRPQPPSRNASISFSFFLDFITISLFSEDGSVCQDRGHFSFLRTFWINLFVKYGTSHLERWRASRLSRSSYIRLSVHGFIIPVNNLAHQNFISNVEAVQRPHPRSSATVGEHDLMRIVMKRKVFSQ